MKAKRTFKSLFWPAFIELLFFMLMGTIDTLMLSSYDDFAVGAVGNAVTLINMFAVLILVISTGVAILVSQHIGANQEERAKQVIGTGLIVNICVGLVLASGLYLLASPLLKMVNTDVIIFDDSMTYLRIISLSLFFLAISNVITGSLRSFGYARYVTYIVVFGNILNIIGNYLLIYGRLGFPSLGVFGASLSTLVVRGIMLMMFLVMLRQTLRVRKEHLRLNRMHLKKVLGIGLPSALESWVYTLMQGTILSIINGLGAEYVVARTYINTMLTYVYVCSLALATANAIITGYAVGEKDYEKAYRHTFDVVIKSFMVVGVVTLLLNIFSYQVLSLFTSNPMIIRIARNVLWIVIFLEIGRATNLVIIQALRSSGDARYPLRMAIISMLGLAIPLAFILARTLSLGLFGIYLALAFDEMHRAFWMAKRWRSKRWITLLEQSQSSMIATNENG